MKIYISLFFLRVETGVSMSLGEIQKQRDEGRQRTAVLIYNFFVGLLGFIAYQPLVVI